MNDECENNAVRYSRRHCKRVDNRKRQNRRKICDAGSQVAVLRRREYGIYGVYIFFGYRFIECSRCGKSDAGFKERHVRENLLYRRQDAVHLRAEVFEVKSRQKKVTATSTA